MPSDALQSINRLRLPFPLLFEVRKFGRSSTPNASQNAVMNQYRRRIEDIYRSTNPTKIKKIDKWLLKYADNPHALYTKICKTYGILPKKKISTKEELSKIRRKSGHTVKQKSSGKQFCSVYEFSSPQPDSIYIPHWMMQNLGIDEGAKVELQSQFNVPKGTFCRLQPFKQEFMEKVSTIGYKSTLEHSLRHYSALSVDQRIVVEFNHFPYECVVRELKPANCVSILGSTDLEIEFEEPIENEDQYGVPTQRVDADHNKEEDEETVRETTTDRDEESSSLGLSDLEQSVEALSINGVVDGALLKKLGVPLDYNEQTNLATMIIENRKLQKENDQRFGSRREQSDNLVAGTMLDDDDDDGDGNDDVTAAEALDGDEKTQPNETPQRGPDDVECENCGKFVHSMSIQMHTMHCIRKNTTCSVCGECIKIEDKERHFEEEHMEITCICQKVCVGKRAHRRHSTTECTLRLRECPFCGRDNVTANLFEEHVAECKETEVSCTECGVPYLLKDKGTHDCGVVCPLCGDRIAETKDKLLHLITVCRERRAICNYCGVLRKCDDMDEHRQFCGSRSEKCEGCNEFVSLMNMELHLQSNCQWFNNKQLSTKKGDGNGKKKKKKRKDGDSNPSQNAEYRENPYIDEQVMFDELSVDGVGSSSNKNSIFGLLAQNPEPNLIATGTVNTKQLCPHCTEEDRFMELEEFEMHMAVSHPTLVDDTITQTVMASFNDPNLLAMSQGKRRKLSADATDLAVRGHKQSKTEQWSCRACTFINAVGQRKCQLCRTPKS